MFGELRLLLNHALKSRSAWIKVDGFSKYHTSQPAHYLSGKIVLTNSTFNSYSSKKSVALATAKLSLHWFRISRGSSAWTRGPGPLSHPTLPPIFLFPFCSLRCHCSPFSSSPEPPRARSITLLLMSLCLLLCVLIHLHRFQWEMILFFLCFIGKDGKIRARQ